MSRSHKHTPICGIAQCHSRKKWLTAQNQRYRTYVRDQIRHENYDDIQGFCGRFANEWDSPRDGKQYFGHMKHQPCYDNHIEKVHGFEILYNCTKHKHEYSCQGYYKKLLRK